MKLFKNNLDINNNEKDTSIVQINQDNSSI
jgi:hypothetical protein